MARKWVSAAAVAVLTVLTGIAPAAAYPGQGTHSAGGASPVSDAVADIGLKLLRDGGLQVTEKITVPDGGRLAADLPLRVPGDGGPDRVYTVRSAVLTRASASAWTDDRLGLTFPSGESTVVFTADGALSDVGGGQLLRWPALGGFDQPVREVRVSLLAPERPGEPVACVVGGRQACTHAEIDGTGVLRAQQRGLRAGDLMEVSATLPPGTAPANAQAAPRLAAEEATAGPFSFGPAEDAALVALVTLVTTANVVVWLRRRAAAAAGADVAVHVLAHRDGRTVFASPDGVLPGQVGTVADGSADPEDIAATVLDLAVRNYLWLAELPGPDWQISRGSPPGGDLREYERLVLEALLPEGTDTVLLSRAHGAGTAAIRDAMYRDVVASGWFSRRPDLPAGRLALPGMLLCALGAAATAVLAVTVGHALLGVAVAIAGLGLGAARALLPARTARGDAVAARITGLHRYLSAVRAEDIESPADRETVFSRSLPYAVALGETERWLAAFAGLDPADDRTPGLSWFGGLEADRDLARLRRQVPKFLSALNEVLARND
ncbi:DUF2207 domain-containing protein [Amycolatopsis rubida]|uniref:Predicted membrane protein n=1 Tax=Amycolatopsis rubida TaxID=112413 RepID=A0A1I5XAH9_9PSEU|nr:DUF2207 domain-containing protein [Amycolatopsis rubida]SFQ28931.1 Predicted membrane protein [Amycolatopsis rubida]